MLQSENIITSMLVKLIAIVTLVALLLGCTMLPVLHTPADINRWIYDNVAYLEDVDDEWQLPETTLRLETGDCEDFAILFMYMTKRLCDQEARMIIYLIDGDIHHGAPLLDGRVYEPTGGYSRLLRTDRVIKSNLSYDEAMYTALIQ